MDVLYVTLKRNRN